MAYTTNISRGGMFVLTDEPLPMDSLVQVALELPDDDGDGPVVPCVARVAYVNDGVGGGHRGMGLELVDVPAAIIQELLLQALTADADPEAELAATADARVLVVDDEPMVRQHTVEQLSSAFHNLETAENGLDALGKALANPPDIILSDVEMPGMDGWQLLRILRSRPNLSDVPVIFLTRLRGERERLRGYQLGVDDYLGKPAVAAELVPRIRGLLLRVKARPGGRDVLRGDLSQVSIASVLSFLEQERRSGHLLVIREGSLATLMVRSGRIIRAQVPKEAAQLPPLEGLFSVLSWDGGRFEFVQQLVEGADEIQLPTSAVLLEWARLHDEATRP